jgi:alanyl aminopeptidase
MGNLVTMAWWDDLWLAEAFATFLGDKAAAEVGAFGDDALRLLLDLEDARAADAEPEPAALHRAIADGDDVDETFDAIAYEKGRAVLVMFERFVGEETMRSAVRAYVMAHANGSATTADFAAALGKAAGDPAVGRALESVVRHRGAPVVALELRCTANGTPTVIGTARDGVTVPVCVRYPSSTACVLVGARAELALTGAKDCVPWLVGNDRALGYYEVVQAQATVAPLGALAPAERLARAHDLAGAVRRGELAIDKAAAAAKTLAASGDAYAELGALAIVRAIDPVIADADRTMWAAWLAKAFEPALTARALLSPRSATEWARRDAVLAAMPSSALPRQVVARAAKLLDRELRAKERDLELVELALRLSAHIGGTPLWKSMQRAIAEGDEDTIAVVLAGAPALGAAFAKDIADAIEASKLPSGPRATAYLALLSHPATRAAAWPIVAPKLASILTALKPADARSLIAALGQTCDATVRDGLPTSPPDAVDAARLTLDRCLARRSTAGPLRLPAN